MKLEIKGNTNYTAVVVSIKDKIELEGCDNICATNIFGNNIIISKDTEIGTKGLYFPVECSLSEEFLSNNNLFRDKEKNVDKEKAGFFEYHGRIKAMKLRGYQSAGFFIPIRCLDYLNIDIDNLNENDTFDTIDSNQICKKYIVKHKQQQGLGNKESRLNKRLKRISKLVDDQFKFHIDTPQLGKEIHKLNPNTFLSISQKIHGTSFITSKILVKKKLNIIEKILKFMKFNIIDTEYGIIFSSRKVIKNQYMEDQVKEHQHFYKEDIWGHASKQLEGFLENGMTLYGEIVGYLPNSNSYIQKPFDYGCKEGEYKIYVYRITYTNNEGKVFEFSMPQVQEWCAKFGQYSIFHAVPLIYYGKVKDLFEELWIKHYGDKEKYQKIKRKYGCKEYNYGLFLDLLKKEYLEKDCDICQNKVPAEGVVLRPERLYIDAYKLKSFRFLKYESKQIDSGEENIEDSQ